MCTVDHTGVNSDIFVYRACKTTSDNSNISNLYSKCDLIMDNSNCSAYDSKLQCSICKLDNKS